MILKNTPLKAGEIDGSAIKSAYYSYIHIYTYMQITLIYKSTYVDMYIHTHTYIHIYVGFQQPHADSQPSIIPIPGSPVTSVDTRHAHDKHIYTQKKNILSDK